MFRVEYKSWLNGLAIGYLCEDFGDNWPRLNGGILYMLMINIMRETRLWKIIANAYHPAVGLHINVSNDCDLVLIDVIQWLHWKQSSLFIQLPVTDLEASYVINRSSMALLIKTEIFYGIHNIY